MDMLAKYEAAQRLLTQHTRNAVLNGRPSVTWMDGFRFSYPREKRGEHGIEMETVVVDSKTCAVTIEKTANEQNQVQIERETGRKIGVVQSDDRSYSPTKAYAITSVSHNLVLTDLHSNETTQLTFDGEPWLEYGCYIDIYSQITVQRSGSVQKPNILWSPDGKYFITYRSDRRSCRKLYLLESYVDSLDRMRPELWQYPCPFVMDSDEEIPHYQLYLGNTEDKTFQRIDAPDFLYPIYTASDRSWVRWMDDSKGFYFTWIKRGFQEGRMYYCDAETAKTRLLVKETTDTFLNLGAFGQVDGYGSYLFSNFVSQDRKWAFYQSEMSGYAHLYRFDISGMLEDDGDFKTHFISDFEDSSDPDLKDLISEKELIVQKIIKADDEAERIYFMANHADGCSDEVYYQLYSVTFDGTELTRLTPEDAVHTVSIGADTFVDTYSRVDLPPVTVLRALNDGSLLLELETADVTELMALGYQMPERFTVTAADGVTELYGIMVKPADFDPNKKYPVIDYIYGGAQLYNVPRDFTWDNSMNREVMGGLQEFAQLGFVAITIDGRGIPGRGKAFHTISYKNLHGCAGLEDHVYCAKELEEKFPFMDMDRVGMWGNSGGGYATVSAMFKYPEFYKVGVASSGNYDQRMYEHSWTERYNGLYDPDVYIHGDITQYAKNLKGKLMLAYGAMDDNVTMSQTIRLCDELNKYNKDYELLVLPRMNHNVPSDLYFIRRKMDFFVKHLLKEEPPKEFTFDCM